MLCWASRQVMSSGERSVLSSNISTWGKKGERKKNRGWVLGIGKLWGASIFSTCLASPLSTALTAEHVSDPVKGLCTFLPGLMSGSSQGSAVSSRGGANRVGGWGGGGGADHMLCSPVSRSHVWVYEWNKVSFYLYIVPPTFEVWIILNQDNCAAVVRMRAISRCAETAVLMAKAHTSCYTWGRCMRDSSVGYSKENVPHITHDCHK